MDFQAIHLLRQEEKNIINSICINGKTTRREIAEFTGYSDGSVKNYLSIIYKKLGIKRGNITKIVLKIKSLDSWR